MQVFADILPALQVYSDFSAFILEKSTLLVFKYYTKIVKSVSRIMDFWFRVIDTRDLYQI